MRILLIRPPVKYIMNQKPVSGYNADLGLLYLAAYLESHGKEVEILDLLISKDPWKLLKEKLNHISPDLVGITSYTPQIKEAHLCATIVKENICSPTVIGGIHASCLPHSTLLNYPMFDFLVFGEGEITLLELVECLENNLEYQAIKGLAFRQNGEIIVNPERPPIDDLDKIPFPARNKIPIEKYVPPVGNYYTLPSTTILSSRGCPFRCNFCSRGGTRYRYKLRQRNIPNVIAEIKECIERYNIRDFRFVDDVLTIPRRRIVDLCESIIENKLHIKWSCFSRVDGVDRELLKLMRRAGCYNINYGVEVGSERVLRSIKKDTTLEQACYAIKLTKETGIETKASFMIGIPGETVDEIRMTLDFAIELSPDFAFFGIFWPIPGSELFDKALGNNELLKKDFSKLADTSSPNIKGQIEVNILNELLTLCYRKFYFRLGYIIQRINRLIRNPTFHEIKTLLAGCIQTIRILL